MTENKKIDEYIEHQIKQHSNVIEFAHADGDIELEHRAYWIKYGFLMMQDYLSHLRSSGLVFGKENHIAGMCDD